MRVSSSFWDYLFLMFGFMLARQRDTRDMIREILLHLLFVRRVAFYGLLKYTLFYGFFGGSGIIGCLEAYRGVCHCNYFVRVCA